MSTPAQAPAYLDENGNPRGGATPSAPAPVSQPPQAQPPGAMYLDEQGNPKGPAAPKAAAPQGLSIRPQPKADDVDPSLLPGNPLVNRLSMPLVKGLIAAHDKLREVENLTQEGREAHPIQAHLGDVANRIEGLLTGNPTHPEAGIGTGEEGLLTNPVTGSLIPGAEGTPALAEGLESAAKIAKGGYQAAKEAIAGGKEGVSKLAGDVVHGKSVAQAPAKAAIREAVGAEDDATLLEGNKTIVDDHLNNIAQQEKAAYSKMDEAAGFDVKEAKIRLKNDQYKLKQLGNTEADQNAREKLTTAIKDTSDRISDAQKKMSDAGIDVSAADNLHKARMAGQEFKKALVRNLSSDGESVNVDGLLKATKNLRALSKYGDRLEQFLGKEGADGFMEALETAQKAGQKALSRQQLAIKLAKYGIPATATIGGAAYELAK